MTTTNRNKVVLVSALTAAALGVAGLAALAIPAGAGEQPSLPAISAEELVASVASAKPPAAAGTVHLDNALGLPSIPGLPQQARNGTFDFRVWYDGDGRARVSIPAGSAAGGEQTIVYDGTTLWRYDSASRTVTKAEKPDHGKPGAAPGEAMDPASAAKQLLDLVRPTSRISVDGTAKVADRPAYELVLAPAPTERTLLREVRVAVDSETRIPLRLEVLANGSNSPVLSVGFSQLTVGPQDASLFTFTPPAGAKVVTPEQAAEAHGPFDGKGGPFNGKGGLFDGVEPTFVGDGWDTVAVIKLPGDLFGSGPAQGAPQGFDPKALLDHFGTKVSGPWGSGHLISTAVVSVIIADDGRVAIGAVPQQVLVEALSR
jgi:outer membrane lipoprotein-sorting protein